MCHIDVHLSVAAMLPWLVAVSNLFAARIFAYREQIAKLSPFVREVFIVQNMMPSAIPWRGLLVAAGIAQLILVVASLAIPRLLNWKGDLAKLRPLTRQVFWTYAGYIWVTNLSFGLVSMITPQLLLDRSPLAGLVSSFIAVYWGARVAIQFAYFDRTDAPKGRFFVLGETALVTLFVGLTIVYGGLVARAFGALGQ